MINVNLNLECENVAEILDAISKLRANGVNPSVSVSKSNEPDDEPKGGKGPFELKFNEVMDKQFRFNQAEKPLFESGQMTREQIIAARLGEAKAAYTALVETLPEDDGKKSVWGD